MNIQLLKKLYSIYSPSGKEQKMVKFLCSYIKQLPGNISVSKDKFGNLYVVLYTISLILHCLRKDTPGQQTGTWNAESSIEKDKQVTSYAVSHTPPVPPCF